MVWVKYKEKFHGSTTNMWMKQKSLAAARSHARAWNKYSNPQEHLYIMKSNVEKPKHLIKKHANIYFERKHHIKKQRRTTRRQPTMFRF